MPDSNATKPVYTHWHITVDRATEQTVKKIQKKVLVGGSRSAAIRYLAHCYRDATSKGSEQNKAI